MNAAQKARAEQFQAELNAKLDKSLYKDFEFSFDYCNYHEVYADMPRRQNDVEVFDDDELDYDFIQDDFLSDDEDFDEAFDTVKTFKEIVDQCGFKLTAPIPDIATQVEEVWPEESVDDLKPMAYANAVESTTQCYFTPVVSQVGSSFALSFSSSNEKQKDTIVEAFKKEIETIDKIENDRKIYELNKIKVQVEDEQEEVRPFEPPKQQIVINLYIRGLKYRKVVYNYSKYKIVFFVDRQNLYGCPEINGCEPLPFLCYKYGMKNDHIPNDVKFENFKKSVRKHPEYGYNYLVSGKYKNNPDMRFTNLAAKYGMINAKHVMNMQGVVVIPNSLMIQDVKRVKIPEKMIMEPAVLMSTRKVALVRPNVCTGGRMKIHNTPMKKSEDEPGCPAPMLLVG